MARNCVGCGAVLQSERIDDLGYVPASALERNQPLCRRCFRIRNYGEVSRVTLPVERYAKEVSQVMQRPGLVLYILDVFDISGSMIPGLAEYIGQSPVIAVVNKIDLLPRDVSFGALRQWMLKTLAESGIKVVDVCFVSAEKQSGIDVLIQKLSTRQEPRVYAVGMANVGKSSVLNCIVEAVSHAKHPFTASRMPGTTLGVARSKLDLTATRSVSLLDTPGLILHQRATDKLCADCLKVVIPQVTVRPRIFQLSALQTLFFGGLARLDFRDGERQSIVCYVSNDLVVHRTKTDRADEFAEMHKDDILKVPCVKCCSDLGDWVHTDVQLGRSGGKPRLRDEVGMTAGPSGCDIVLAGVGWIALSGAQFEGTLHTRVAVGCSVRGRLIGQLNHQVQQRSALPK